MARSLDQALIETREYFRTLVWPVWQDRLGASDLVSTEGSEEPLERRLDFGGVDGFFARKRGGVLIPLASRIEFASSPNVEVSRRLAPRFTIRTERKIGLEWSQNSEMRRLLTAFRDPVARRYLPYRTFHSLVSREAHAILFTSAVCTIELCQFLDEHIESSNIERESTKSGDARFIKLPISMLKAAGINVETIWP
jgi:hypothetical protein